MGAAVVVACVVIVSVIVSCLTRLARWIEAHFATRDTWTTITASTALLSLPYWVLLVVGAASPLIGLTLCLLLSTANTDAFQAATATHCNYQLHLKTRNFAPSVSVAVGDFSPQRYIWRSCIMLQVSRS